MFKRITFASVGIVLFAFPLIASAACVDISSTLRLGSRGAEVSALQTFFVDTYQDFPAPTGYFGPTTQAALRQWQSERGIVSSGTALTTGYGVTGPKTRAALACTSGSTASTVSTMPTQSTSPTTNESTLTVSPVYQALTASPTSGAAPLAVTFQKDVLTPQGAYTIDFGDGTTGSNWLTNTIVCITTPCGPFPETMLHTYSSPGVYTAKLLNADQCVTTGCNQVGSVAVSVDSVPVSYKSYPTVALDTLPSTLSDGRLIRFKITAASSGTIGLAQMIFSVNTPPLGGVVLGAYTDPAYSAPISGAVGGSIPVTQGLTDQGLTYYTAIPSTPVEIPAGMTYYFELRGNMANSSSVTTTLLGDSQLMSLTSCLAGFNGGNFIWSPNTTSISTCQMNDWTNSYRIAGLPANGISQTRTNGTQSTITVDSSPQSIPSTGYTTFTFTYPSDAVSAIFRLPCPSGVKTTSSAASDMCNKDINVTNQSSYRTQLVNSNYTASTILSQYRVQLSNGQIVSATREATVGPTVDYLFAAQPASGQAPLTVRYVTSQQYGTISDGEGNSGTCDPSTNCDWRLAGWSHVYNTPGTYTARYSNSSNSSLTGSATITVTGQGSANPMLTSVSPVQGSAGTIVTLQGNGFSAAGNPTIEWMKNGVMIGSSYGPGNILFVSSDGKTLQFKVDPIFAANSSAGLYQIRYSNGDRGSVSNTLNFALTAVDRAATISASPTFGPAPLAVNFTLTNGADGVLYSLDFGDGTGSAQLKNGGGVMSNVAHTYSKVGNYTAKLSRSDTGACGSGYCATSRVVATATITVSGTANQVPVIYSLSPVSGPGGTKVNVTGANFGSINTILFNGSIPGVTSSDGKQLSFTVPVNTPPGSYGVSVTNNANNYNSNTMTFTVSNSQSSTLSVAPGTQPPDKVLSPGDAHVPFATVVLKNTGTANVTIRSLTVKMYNSGGYAVVKSVLLMDGNLVLGPAQPLDANHQAVLGDPFTLSAGVSKTLTVVADMSSDFSADAGNSMQLAIIAVSTDAMVSGTLPVYGATHKIGTSLSTTIAITSPNGGETVAWGPGQSMTIKYNITGAPTNGTVCTLLYDAAGLSYFIPNGSDVNCKPAVNGLGSVTAHFDHTPFDLKPGAYRASAYVTIPPNGSQVAEDKSDSTFTLGTAAPTITYTINGSTNLTAKVGDTLTHTWKSTNASSIRTTFTQDSTSCGLSGTGPFDYGTNPSTVSGTFSEVITDCWAGHSYVVTGTVTDKQGKTASANVKIQVSPISLPAPTVTLSATPNAVDAGKSAALTWSSTGATSCTGTGFTTGGATKGVVAVTPAKTTTYTIVCSNANKVTASNSAIVIVRTASTAASAETLSQLGSVLTALQAFLKSIQGR